MATLGGTLKLHRLRAEHLVSEDNALTQLLGWLSRTPSAQEKTMRALHVRPQAFMPGTSFHACLETLLRLLGHSLEDLDGPVLLTGTLCALRSRRAIKH